ncbi:hypothetical protein SUGI_0945380 [Cryptomeria japonica]|nr:hypothetical protein SUGI_0945380 [Cryptomeria japonica]
MTDSSSEKLHAKWPKISTQELRTHNNVDDLWLSIQGKVYDVTKWVNTHPGGDLPLLNLAGQDVTDAFIAYHPGSAWKYLDQFMIGVHEDYEVSEISKDYRRLLGDLKKAGLFKRPKYVYGLIGLLMVAMLVMSVVGVLFYEGFWTHVACGVLMGAVWTQSGWIGHDSGHCGLVGNKRIDRIIQLVAGNGLTGISIAWWKRNHNAHHIACNSLEFDPDLQYIPLFAVSSRAKEIVGLVAFWIWFPLLISCMPTWSERSAFVLSSFMVTGVQHVQFCLNHFSSSVYVGRPCSKNWFESQTKGTLDISCSPWLDWFHGGLQHQVEHHLFPRLPRHNLRKIAPFVKPLCLKYQLPYTMVTFWEANLMTIRTLRAAALEAQDMSKPVPKNLLWEALNTHG